MLPRHQQSILPPDRTTTIDAHNHSYVIDGEQYVFTAIAAVLAYVNKDYISRLCRDSKLKARRFAGQWLVNVASLRTFFLQKGEEESSRARIA